MKVGATASVAAAVCAALVLATWWFTRVDRRNPSTSVSAESTLEKDQVDGGNRQTRPVIKPQPTAPAPLATTSAADIFDQEAPTISPRALGDAFEVGVRRVEPDRETRAAILVTGKRILYPVFRVCVDVAGRVSEVSIIVTSGFARFDEDMMGTIRDWRYTPFLDQRNAPTEVCSSLVLPQVIH